MTTQTASIAITIAASLTAAPASAQLNSPSVQGYLDRGVLMYAHRIYQGTLDQAAEALRLSPATRPDQQALYLEAMSALRTGRPDAAALLDDFAATYPESALIPYVTIGRGDCMLALGNYPEALKLYSQYSLSSFADSDTDDLVYRRAYCCLMTGDYRKARQLFERVSHTQPYGPTARFYMAYASYATGEYEQALRQLATLPRSTEAPLASAPYYRAQIYYRTGEWTKASAEAAPLVKHPTVPAFTPEAMRILGESLWNNPASTPQQRQQGIDMLWRYAASVEAAEPSALYILGVAEYDAGHYSESIGLLQRVVADSTPTAQSAYLYMGQAYSRLGNSNGALMAYEHAYRLDFSRNVAETAFYNYAVTRMEGGNAPFAGTVKIFEDFLRQYPHSRHAADVESFLVSGYLAENDYEAALAAIERSGSRTPAIEAARQRVLFVLGTRDYANGRYSQALDRLQQARAAGSPDRSIALQSLIWSGDCHYALEQYPDAEADYAAYLKQAPATDANRATALYDLAYARFAARNYAGALSDFKHFTALGTADAATEADAYTRMGDCRYYSNSYSAAAADYRQAFDLSPATGDYPLFQLALMKGFMREHQAKLSTLDQMLSRYPGSPLAPRALLEQGETYSLLDNSSKAIATYHTLVDKYPATAQGRRGLLQLAIVQAASGQRSEAADSYRQVISRWPSSEEAALALDDLKRIHAADGTLDRLTAFMATVENAPALDPSEYDELSFNAARDVYVRTDDTSRLQDYLKQYPHGARRAQALYYLAEAEAGKGNSERVISLTGEMLSAYPDAEGAEEAMLLKAEAEGATGRAMAAFTTYRGLENRASTPAMQRAARMGVLRQGTAAGQWAEVAEAASRLEATSSAGQTDPTEIGWAHGRALSGLGRNDEAAARWSKVVALGRNDEYSSRSAVDLATLQLGQGQTDQARRTAEKFINSNPPQPYWLARGFIVLSDILRRQGNTFEADEYLRSLRNNYPGDESDIFSMIDQRLKD